MQTPQTFAFRLAGRDTSPKKKWKAREGGAVAGCTEVKFSNYRMSDNGVFC